MSSALYKLRVVLWGVPPSTAIERRLLFKLDFFILSFACLLLWSNYLNRVNFQNAYVSGMREDVHFQGKQYSIVNTLFTVGYIIGQIPNNLMLQVIPANYWMPGMAMLWAMLSMCTAAATQPSHVMAIRFFQGIVESSTFSGVHYILGSWYTEAEIGKRSAIFSTSAQLGSLFSGVLQGSIVSSLQGYRGLDSWQWLFLLDGIIAIPIAIYGFLCFPGTPTMGRGRNKTVWFLSEEERQLAITRLPPKPKTKLSPDLIKRVLLRWHWYAFSALFAISSMLESVGSNGIIQLWLATYPLDQISSQDRNFYPLGATSVAIAATLIAAWITDFTRKRWPVK
jgi:ACS family pantothenate transporter-like MFS transporter